MGISNHSLSRRGFITGAATASALAAFGLAGCSPKKTATEKTETAASDQKSASNASDWLGSAPEIASADIKETRETDLLIIGAGNGGMAAAATAADLGIDFTLCEKASKIQRSRHWFGAINTKYTEAAGLRVDTGKLLNEFTRYASGQADQRVVKVWIDESSDVVDWIDPILTSAGMKCAFDGNIDHKTGGTDFYVAPMEHYYSGTDANGEKLERNTVLLKYINDKGHDVTYDHALVKLVQSESGKVTGAIFQTGSGYVQINSKKGVLLTTGGYVSNDAMLRACNPMVDRCVTLQYGSPNNVGDGIRAALWAGAQKDAVGAPMIFDRGAVLPGQDAGIASEPGEPATFVGTDKQFNLGSQPLMKVARNGKRFCNESTPYDFCCFAAAANEGGVFAQIFDSNLKEDVKRFSTIGCSRQTQQLLAKEADTPLDAIYADQLDKGTMVKADTLDELADKLGFAGEAKQAFLSEVEKYNGFYDKQEDADFGKEAYRLSAIKTAPFYGTWFGGSILTTVDGIRINEHMQALDAKGRVIEGLYAAGDCSGSMFANNYPEYIVGCACGRTLTFSRHAVRHMAGDIK
ncbi:fumarate reductase [Berryella intestinalis]|uniref:Fumarate reductase n=1 Tax=Berryella intestinalis TaxID=1531429 RepID=A0A0A8B1P1_9ACTN|nr:FAD-binding protein [Berryella intestinalis]AJC11406.1 fumarate reductase [Berryella intestinalis]